MQYALLQSDEYSHPNFVLQTGTDKENTSSAPIILVLLTVASRFVHEGEHLAGVTNTVKPLSIEGGSGMELYLILSWISI